MDSLFASGGRIRMFALLSARSLYRFAMRITPGLSSLLFTPSLPLFATSFPPVIKSLVYKKFFARFEKYSLVRLKLNLPFTHRLNRSLYIFFNRTFELYFLFWRKKKNCSFVIILSNHNSSYSYVEQIKCNARARQDFILLKMDFSFTNERDKRVRT